MDVQIGVEVATLVMVTTGRRTFCVQRARAAVKDSMCSTGAWSDEAARGSRVMARVCS